MSVTGSGDMGAAVAGDAGRAHHVSFFGSIRPYNRDWLSGDVVAGVTLAALAIPG